MNITSIGLKREGAERLAFWMLGLMMMGMILSSCHREACPGSISQADQEEVISS